MADQEVKEHRMTEIRRVIGIFWEPRPVFEDLSARPRWWAPLILLTVLAIAYVYAFSSIVGWSEFMRRQFETNARLQQLPLEQQLQIMQQQVKMASTFGYVGAAVGVALSMAVVAAVLLGVFNLIGEAGLKFRQAFSITCYSWLPTGVSTALSMIVMFFKDPADFDLQNPLVLNVGAFLDPASTPKWLYSVAMSLDAFSIWIMLLLALGFSIGSRTVGFAKSFVLVAFTWAVYVALKSGWASLFG